MVLKGSDKGGEMETKLRVKFQGIATPKKFVVVDKPTELDERYDEAKKLGKSGVLSFTSLEGEKIDIFLNKVQFTGRSTEVGERKEAEEPPGPKEEISEPEEDKKLKEAGEEKSTDEDKTPGSKEELEKEADEKEKEETQ